MSCKDRNCVCEAVEAILDAQEAVEDRCPTSCFSDLLSPVAFRGDTIPFMLFTKKGKPFSAFGNVGRLMGAGNRNQCFTTFFFRVENVKDCCATLRLLRPLNPGLQPINNLDDPCDVFALERTDFCIEVDLDCFCAIQCLSPELLMRERGRGHHED